MAEVLRKCVQLGDPDPNLFDFLETKIKQLNDGNDLHVLPLNFILELTDVLGIKPLVSSGEESVFNIESGLFQQTTSINQVCREGDGVKLILAILVDHNDIAQDRRTREEALKIMMEYYQLHIPRFGELDSYEIVKEVLNA